MDQIDIDQVIAAGTHQQHQDIEEENLRLDGPPIAPLNHQLLPTTVIHYNHSLGDGTTHTPQNRLNMLDFILQPIPQFLKIQCRIFRYRDGINKLGPGYEAFLEDGHQQIFLMSARKLVLVAGQPSIYFIYDSPLSEAQAQTNIVAKIKSNFLGTAFTITSAFCDPDPSSSPSVTNPTDSISTSLNNNSSSSKLTSWWQTTHLPKPTAGKKDKWHEELASVLYEPNILGFKGPRKMTILLPLMSPEGRIQIIPRNESETLLERMKSDEDPLIIKLNNKNPQWNEETHSYVLNFNGRVSLASVKNFQIIHPHDLDYIVMQFGRADEGTFSMDAQYPLSPIQAFGICLSSFDAKLACE